MRFPLLAKMAAIGLVMLLLALVLMRIDGLVDERRMRQDQALHSVTQSLSAAQTLVGPLLQRRCSEEWDTVEGEGAARRSVTASRTFLLHATPQSLAAQSQATAEARHRGLFKVNGYAGATTLTARWSDLAALQPAPARKGSRLACEPATVLVALSDPRGIRAATVTIDGATSAVQPGTGHDVHALGLHAVLGAARSEQADRPLAVTVALDLVGTARLSLVPAADQVAWTMRSDWPHPSFGGRFLPVSRNIDATGFTATWAVSALSSPAAADLARGQGLCPMVDRTDESTQAAPPPARDGGRCLDTIDVSFIDPVNPYSLTDRAVKYALLFIVLTFAAVALSEVLSRRRVHPVQYALVGLALALFFLLLLSLSEHIAFGHAYAAAAAACVALLAFYATHMLGSARAGLAFGAGVALLYGLLWVLLRMEQWALVMGSALLFAVLVAAMVLTRRIDWYAYASGLRQTAPG